MPEQTGDDRTPQKGEASAERSDDESARRIDGESAQAMIRPARELAGISLRELARRVGVSVGTMSAIETGKTVAGTDRLDVIAAELGTTVQRLSAADPIPTAEPSRAAFDWRVYPALDLDPVLAAAMACFVDTGYHGATMRTIAAAAGISVPGVYHHYASKQALLVAAIDLAAAELRAHLRAARNEGAEPVARLANLSEALTRFAVARHDLARIVVAEAHAADEADARLAALRHESMMLLRNEIESGASSRTLHVDDPDDAARAILSLCLGVSGWVARDRTGVDDNGDGGVDTEVTARRYARYSVRIAGGDRQR